MSISAEGLKDKFERFYQMVEEAEKLLQKHNYQEAHTALKTALEIAKL